MNMGTTGTTTGVRGEGGREAEQGEREGRRVGAPEWPNLSWSSGCQDFGFGPETPVQV